MYSTPISPSYFDNPSTNMEYINTLTDEETKVYTFGYIQACHHVQEALGDSKRKFLAAALNDDDDIAPEYHDRMLDYVKLLDSLDISLEHRVEFLRDSCSH